MLFKIFKYALVYLVFMNSHKALAVAAHGPATGRQVLKPTVSGRDTLGGIVLDDGRVYDSMRFESDSRDSNGGSIIIGEEFCEDDKTTATEDYKTTIKFQSRKHPRSIAYWNGAGWSCDPVKVSCSMLPKRLGTDDFLFGPLDMKYVKQLHQMDCVYVWERNERLERLKAEEFLSE